MKIKLRYNKPVLEFSVENMKDELRGLSIANNAPVARREGIVVESFYSPSLYVRNGFLVFGLPGVMPEYDSVLSLAGMRNLSEPDLDYITVALTSIGEEVGFEVELVEVPQNEN